MIIIFPPIGQLGNQLLRLSHHMVNSFHYNYPVKALAFTHQNLFPNFEKYSKFKSYPVYNNSYRKALLALTKCADNKYIKSIINLNGCELLDRPYTFNVEDKKFIDDARNKVILATNWEFRDYENFKNYSDRLRYIFKIKEQFYNEADKFLCKLKSKYDLVIGVHVRRGDYKNWRNGVYYYDDIIYNRIMFDLQGKLKNKSIAYVVCSDSSIQLENYKNVKLYISNNTNMVDLAILSKCDMIIGPPSTFSGWASFSGNVPLYHIIDKHLLPEINDFSVNYGFETFKRKTSNEA